MNTNDFLRTIETSKIAKHKEFIHQAIRPAIDIVMNKNAKPILGCSRFGGMPDLPDGSQWPTHNAIPHRFLGQINFADIPPNDSALPSSGLLSIFVALDFTEDGDEHIFWNDDGYIRTIFTPTLDSLAPIAPPSGFGIENPCEVVLEFYPTIDIPFDEYQVGNWPFKYGSEESKAYSEIRASLHKSNDYLLGYPSHCSLAYNPAPGMEWISLLTVGSDDSLQWRWHDGDNLMIFIEAEKLKNRDFGILKSDAG
jgi:uncharacterized protein YwqG